MPYYNQLDVEIWWHAASRSFPENSIFIYRKDESAASEILDALLELSRRSLPAKITVPFVESERPTSLRSLKLLSVAARQDLSVMHIHRNDKQAIIEMTTAGLELMIKSVRKWLAGEEDFCISPKHAQGIILGALDKTSASIWFWGPTCSG